MFLATAIAIRTIPPFISGATRFLMAALLMYGWLRLHRERPLAEVNVTDAVICGVLLSGASNGFLAWAQQGVPSGTAALVMTAVPAVVLLLDWALFSKRAPSRKALLGTAIATAGVIAIVLQTRSLSGAALPIHLVALSVGLATWCFGTLIQKSVAVPNTVLSFACVQMLAGGLFQLALSWVSGEWQGFVPSQVSVESATALIYLVLFGSVVSVNVYLWLLTRVSAHKVATYALVNPVVALALGAVVLNETITPLAGVSASLVLIGVGLVLHRE